MLPHPIEAYHSERVWNGVYGGADAAKDESGEDWVIEAIHRASNGRYRLHVQIDRHEADKEENECKGYAPNDGSNHAGQVVDVFNCGTNSNLGVDSRREYVFQPVHYISISHDIPSTCADDRMVYQRQRPITHLEASLMMQNSLVAVESCIVVHKSGLC